MRRTSSISRPYQCMSRMSFVLMAAGCQHRGMRNATVIAPADSTVVIRVATPADGEDLRRLAALDSARPPAGAVLVAESDGEIRAAWSIDEGRAIADPFRPTAGLVALLAARADLLTGARDPGAHGARRRLRLLSARPQRFSPSPRRPAPPPRAPPAGGGGGRAGAAPNGRRRVAARRRGRRRPQPRGWRRA